MLRELSPKQAFQTHCLAQMGIVPWLSVENGATVSGTVFMPVQPWGESSEPIANAAVVEAEGSVQTSGFGAVVADKPVVKMPPEEKEQSVSELREQLNAGPEIIVEDLQPIEELAVDIEIDPELTAKSSITALDVRAYSLSNKLLILSDVPQMFSQEEEVERLALKMGQALLKESVDEWQGSAFSWPGGLKNPQFLQRTDWLFGALESFIARLVRSFPDTPLLVLAGDRINQLVEDLPEEVVLKRYPTAKILSLSELHRIPELRKEAWETMQSSLFNDKP